MILVKPTILATLILAYTTACAASSGTGAAVGTGPGFVADTATETAATSDSDDAGPEVAGNQSDSAADTAVTADAALGPEVAVDVASAPDAAKDVIKAKPNTTGLYKEPGQFPPDFVQVKNSDGTVVSKADLLGHWTVMWFYPAALTSG